MKCSWSFSCSGSVVVVVVAVEVVVVVWRSAVGAVYLSVYLFISLSVCLSSRIWPFFVYPIYLSLYLQAWKRSNSARLPQFLNLTTSKTKQFCETSSIFQVDNIKNEAILRDFLQYWKVECRADGPVPMRSTIFPLHLWKVLRHAAPATKKWLTIPNAPHLRKSAP